MTTWSELPKLPPTSTPCPKEVTWAIEARLLLALTCGWLAFGLAMLFSASLPEGIKEHGNAFHFIIRQLGFAGLGIGTMVLISNISVDRLFKYARLGFVPLLLAVFLVRVPKIGAELNGASRWIQFAGVSIQPSELIKPCLLLIGAFLFARWRVLNPQMRIYGLLSIGLAIAGIALQPDLGTSVLLFLVVLLMAIISSNIRLSWIFSTTMAVAALAALKIFSTPYQTKRITAFTDPWENAQTLSFQLIQSQVAVSNGSLWGTGFGLSVQKVGFLPYSYSDFIFAVISEEFGLIGGALFILFLLGFLIVGLRVAVRCADPVRRLLAAGSTFLLVGQSFLHIAVVIGAVPPKGIPLPLVSYGGSGLIASLVCCGLLIRSAREMYAPVAQLRVPVQSLPKPRRRRRSDRFSRNTQVELRKIL
jgi:cell division protein FtsW